MKTSKIFELNAPYANQFQGKSPRILFVCSVGMLRSATACALAIQRGWNARAVGSSDAALIPLSVNLIMWAEKIVFVNVENYLESKKNTFEITGYDEDIDLKKIIWNIPDNFDYMDNWLCKLINFELDKVEKSKNET